VKCIPTITPGPPVLDEETFQRLLGAAHILQERVDRLRIGNVELSARENAAAQSVDVPVPDSPQEQVSRAAQAGIEPSGHNHWLIPPETAHRFSILASQLEALTQQELRSESKWTRLPVSAAEEITAGPACHSEWNE
jgi:hypothetical protein